MDLYDELTSLCDFVEDELQKVNKKLKSAGQMSGDDISYIDKLTHSLKSIKTIKAMMDAEDGGSYSDGARGSYMGGSNRMMEHDGSYARGRGRNAKRDSMGRYSRRAYDDGMMAELHELMEDAPNEQIKQEFRSFISRVEKM